MGKVYILTNDAMPGIINIGSTENSIVDKMKTLDSIHVPLPFRFHFAIETDRAFEIEKLMHNTFSKFRIRNNRDFFKMDVKNAVSALKITGKQEIKFNNVMVDQFGIKVELEPRTTLFGLALLRRVHDCLSSSSVDNRRSGVR